VVLRRNQIKKPLHEYSCYESKPELDKDWLSHAIIDKTLNDWPNAEQLENREGLAATVEETVKIERKEGKYGTFFGSAVSSIVTSFYSWTLGN